MNLTDHIDRAERAAEAARIVREEMRWAQKPGDPEREDLIEATLEALRQAMAPLRIAIGTIQFGKVHGGQENRLRAASNALQYERKRLKKMRR